MQPRIFRHQKTTHIAKIVALSEAIRVTTCPNRPGGAARDLGAPLLAPTQSGTSLLRDRLTGGRSLFTGRPAVNSNRVGDSIMQNFACARICKVLHERSLMSNMPVNASQQAGIYVRRAREELGITRGELAALAGVSERLIASLELGDAKGIRLDKLLSICGTVGLGLCMEQKASTNAAPEPAAPAAAVPEPAEPATTGPALPTLIRRTP